MDDEIDSYFLKMSKYFQFTHDSVKLNALKERVAMKFGNRKLYSGAHIDMSDPRVSCVIRAESWTFAEMMNDKENATDDFIQCPFWRRMSEHRCGSENEFSKFTYNIATKIVNEFCLDENESLLDDETLRQCMPTFIEHVPFLAHLVQCFIKIDKASSEAERCDVVSECLIDETFRQLDNFCELPTNYAKYFRAITVIQLAEFSEGRLLDKCPQLFRPIF